MGQGNGRQIGQVGEPYLTLTLGKKRQLRDFPANCEGGIAGTILAEARPWRPEDYGTFPPMTALSYKSKLIDIASSGQHNDVRVDELSLTKLILWVDTLCTYRGEQELRSMDDPDPASQEQGRRYLAAGKLRFGRSVAMKDIRIQLSSPTSV